MNNRSFHRQYQNRRRVYEKRLFKGYSIAIGNLYNKFAAGVSTGKGLKAIPSDKIIADIILKNTDASYKTLIRESVKMSLDDVQKAYGKQLPVLVQKVITDADIDNLGMASVMQSIHGNGMKKIVLPEVTRTMKKNFTSIFEKAIDEGKSIKEITKIIQEKGKFDKVYKARRIARTETTRCYNAGAFEGYKMSTVVKQKKWSSNNFGNAQRETHASADGQKVDYDKPFIVGGEELMYPGDENGSPENVVNCLCGMMPVIGEIKAPNKISKERINEKN